MAGRGTPATLLLARQKVPHTVHEYAHDPRAESYGLEAAEALGIAPARVFKTLVADVDGALAVAVVPVTGSLDLKALAAAVGGKRATMADPAYDFAPDVGTSGWSYQVIAPPRAVFKPPKRKAHACKSRPRHCSTRCPTHGGCERG